jgi:HemY protein
MIKFLIYLLIIVLAAWVGVKIALDPGFVVFAYQHWTAEMPLWFFILAFLVTFTLFYFIVAVWRGTSRIPKHLRLLSRQHKLALSHQKTNKGLLELAEGRWANAEKLLVKGASDSAQPLINYLAAAKAAHEQMAYERRDDYLRLAHNTTPEATIAVELTQAELQMSHQQLEHALATLRHLQNKVPQHTYVLKLLQRLYVKLEDWQGLLELMPDLMKYKVLKADEAKALEIQAYCGLFNHVNGLQLTLDKVWDQVPKNLRREKSIVALYVRHLLIEQDDLTAEAVLRDVLKSLWDSELVDLYGETKGQDPDKQLATAEGWLKNHGNSPALLLCLARLAMRNQLWGQAKDYLHTSLNIDPCPQAYAQLGRLSEQLGDMPQALAAYRQAADIWMRNA